MTERDPNQRPDADAAFQQWRKIRGSIFLLHRGLRLHERSESQERAFDVDLEGFEPVIEIGFCYQAWCWKIACIGDCDIDRTDFLFCCGESMLQSCCVYNVGFDLANVLAIAAVVWFLVL